MPARLFIARHCSTDWNLAGRLQGSHDLPLNDVGRSEAEDLVPTIRNLAPLAVYSSPLKRAWQTAQIYATALSVPLTPESGLREIDHGDWEGLGIENLLNDRATGFRRWLLDPGRLSIPSGESIHEAQARVVAAVARIAAASDGPVLVVTHKHIRSLLWCAALGLPLAYFTDQIDDSRDPVLLTDDQRDRIGALHRATTNHSCRV